MSVTGTRTFGATFADKDGTIASFETKLSSSRAFTNGTGPNQVNMVAFRELTHVSATPVVVDLKALTTIAGALANFANIRGTYHNSRSVTDTHVLTIGNSGANAFEDQAMGGTTPALKLEAGASAIIGEKPLGASGLSIVSTNKDIKFDPGTFAGTFITQHIFSGNA